MVYLIKGFREVQKDGVYLARPVKAVEEVTEGVQELRFTAPTLSKAVLEVAENVIVVKMIYDRAIDNMFKKLACNAGEREFSAFALSAFLKRGMMWAVFQSSGTVPVSRDF